MHMHMHPSPPTRHPSLLFMQMELPANRDHFDVVVACEDDNDEDLDVPLVSIKWR